MDNPLLDALAVSVRKVLKNTHASAALLNSARLENMLSAILQGNMPNLSGQLKKRIFEGYGPLGSFSAKIDFAFVLGHINAEEHRFLHAIRDIRNAFAHGNNTNLHFDDDLIVKLLAKLPKTKKPGRANLSHFVTCCRECTGLLNKQLETINLIQALQERLDSKRASTEK
jgi:DNA-binding MltR family transcriptional regulator